MVLILLVMQIKTHDSESRGQGKPPTWLRKTAHAMTTESLLHIQPLLKTEQQNSPFYAFKHFTVVLNWFKIVWIVSELYLNSFAPVLPQKWFYRK